MPRRPPNAGRPDPFDPLDDPALPAEIEEPWPIADEGGSPLDEAPPPVGKEEDWPEDDDAVPLYDEDPLDETPPAEPQVPESAGDPLEEEAPPDDEADWLPLEGVDLVPRGLRVAGYEELVDLPILGFKGLLARLDTGAPRSRLQAPGLPVEDLRTVLHLGGQDQMVTLSTTPGDPPTLVLGRDVLAGWLLVDANHRLLFRR